MILKPVTTEKIVKMMDLDNTLVFEIEKGYDKKKIGDEVEKVFDVKVEKVRTMIKGNKKLAYVKLKKEYPAVDIATKLGMI